MMPPMMPPEDFLVTSLAARFQWSEFPPLERLESDLFGSETDLPEVCDLYGLSLPSGAKALFLYCRDTGRLESDADPDSWSYHNRGKTLEELDEAITVANDIIHLANRYGLEPDGSPSSLRFCFPDSIHPAGAACHLRGLSR